MKNQNFDELHKLKDSEFTELVESISFSNKKSTCETNLGKDRLKNIKKKTFSKYLATATNFTYILISPLVLLLLVYYFVSEYVIHKHSNILLIILIILGIVTGYWTLFKEIRGDKK